jgi:flagellar motor switch protein FliM
MNICIPYFVLEPVLPYLNQGRRLSMERRGDRELQATIAHKVLCGELELRALMGRVNLSLEEFLRIRVGDVLTLPNREYEELELEVGEKVKFLGRPGRMGTRRGFRITRNVDLLEDPIYNEK